MAVPKKKTSKSRRNMRRSHDRLGDITVGECSNCGAKKLPHHLCNSCGYYKGVQIIKVKKEND